MDDITLSIISHGHGSLVVRLLEDLDRIASQNSRLAVVLTLNVPEQLPYLAGFANLDVRIVRNSAPRGFGANHNAALSGSSRRWFAILNPDLRLPTDPFPTLVAAAERDPTIAALSPAVVNSSGASEDHVRPHLTPASLWRRHRGVEEQVDIARPSKPPNGFYWFAGMFLLFRFDAFCEIGGFDERYFLYCEDYDICARLYLGGRALQVVSEVQVVHDAQRDSHRSLKHLGWHLSSLVKVWTSAPFWRILLRLGVTPESTADPSA